MNPYIEAILHSPSEARIREVLEAFACDIVKTLEDLGDLRIIEDGHDAGLDSNGIRASIAAHAYRQIDGAHGGQDAIDAFIARHSDGFDRD